MNLDEYLTSHADSETVSALKLYSTNRTYDELPIFKGKIDNKLIEEAFKSIKKRPTEKNCEMLGIFSPHLGKIHPTIGGLLLFGSNHLELIPDSIIRCARFKGETKEMILDHKDITETLPFAIEEVITFIERHTSTRAKIGRIKREDIPEYRS